MNERESSSIWERLDALDDDELAQLTTAAIMVVGEHGNVGEAAEATRLPRDTLAAQTREVLESEGVALDEGQAVEIVSSTDLSRELSLSFLQAVRDSPVRDEVAQVHQRLRDMMIVDAGLLLAGAVVLLVLKLKRVKVGENEIEFFEVKSDVLKAIKSFLGGA
jgi:hypothetical protein